MEIKILRRYSGPEKNFDYFEGDSGWSGEERWTEVSVDGQTVWDSRSDTFLWRFAEVGWLSELLDLPNLLTAVGESAAATEAQQRADQYLAENARLVAELDELATYENGAVKAQVFWARQSMAYNAYFNPDDFEQTWANFRDARAMLARIEETAKKQAALEADLRLARVINAPIVGVWLDPLHPNPNDFLIPNLDEVRGILEANRQYVPEGIKRLVQFRLFSIERDTYLLPASGQMQEGEYFVWKEWNRRGRCWEKYLFDGHHTVELY